MLQSQYSEISCPVNSLYIPYFQVPPNLETFTALFLKFKEHFPEAKLLLSPRRVLKGFFPCLKNLPSENVWLCLKVKRLNKYLGWALQKKSWCFCSLTKLQNRSVLWVVNCGWPAFLPVWLLMGFLASLGSFYYPHFNKALSQVLNMKNSC